MWGHEGTSPVAKGLAKARAIGGTHPFGPAARRFVYRAPTLLEIIVMANKPPDLVTGCLAVICFIIFAPMFCVAVSGILMMVTGIIGSGMVTFGIIVGIIIIVVVCYNMPSF
jgi:hypothetical protein